jgi:hypothetical protein
MGHRYPKRTQLKYTKQRYRVRNWRQDEVGLRRRGDQGIETRDISDHGFVQSIYFRDPNGYVIELAVRTDTDDASPVEAKSAAREALVTWQVSKETQ